VAEGGPRAFRDEPVLAHLLPGETLLGAEAGRDPMVVHPGHEVVALLVEPGEVDGVTKATIEPEDDPPRIGSVGIVRSQRISPRSQLGDRSLQALQRPMFDLT
jgi:hypothetical protein